MNQNSAQTISRVTAPGLRTVRRLLIAYATVGWLGFATVILLSVTVAKNHSDLVSTTAWVHGLIVALTGIPFVAVADKAAQDKGRAKTRLRIILTIVPIAFIVDIFLLALPMWMNVEQAVCAALLAAAAAAYFTRK